MLIRMKQREVNMNEPEIFVSSAIKGIQNNLKRYIEKARNLGCELGIDFENDTWSKPETTSVRGATAGGKKGVSFVIFPENGRKTGSRSMNEPFKSFAKAVIRHVENNRPQVSHGVLLRALRYLHDQLAGEEYDPVRLRLDHFNGAITCLRSREDISSAYRVGIKLERIAQELRSNNLTLVSFSWSNAIPRPKSQGGSAQLGFSEEAMEYRSERMLTDEQISSIGEVARRVTEPADRICINATILLLCGGFRIGECLTLPADCLVFQNALDDYGQPRRDTRGVPVIDVGIRYWPEKGGHTETAIKWIPTSLKDIAQQAVLEIQGLTEATRANARWLQDHAGRAVLPDPYNKMRSESIINAKEFCEAFGVDLLQDTKFPKFKRIDDRQEPWYVRIGDLNTYLRSRSKIRPMITVPVVQSIEDSLFVVPMNFFHSRRNIIQGTVVPVTDQNVSDFLCGRPGVASVFERLGILGADGSPMSLTSHQPRHFLHTTLAEGGVPEHLLARHFGRSNIGDNQSYDHRTPVQRARAVAEKFSDGDANGSMKRILDRLEPHEKKNFRDVVIATAHRTDFGFCIHDWASMPCRDHGRCIGCTELLFEKGDPESKKRTAEELSDSEWLLERAIIAAEDDIAGADNYRAHHERTVLFARAIMEIHDNPDIPDGTLVHIAEKDGKPFYEVPR